MQEFGVIALPLHALCVLCQLMSTFTPPLPAGGGEGSSSVPVDIQWMINASLIQLISLLSSLNSPKTCGYSFGRPQTSDGLFINLLGGQSRPDENGVQTSWDKSKDCIYLVFWREGERIPKLNSFRILTCGIVFVIKHIILVHFVCDVYCLSNIFSNVLWCFCGLSGKCVLMFCSELLMCAIIVHSV